MKGQCPAECVCGVWGCQSLLNLELLGLHRKAGPVWPGLLIFQEKTVIWDVSETLLLGIDKQLVKI